MTEPEFDTEEERQAYAAGLEAAAEKVRGKPLTREDIRQMTPQEIMKRMPEVRAALKSGEGQSEDDAEAVNA
jgi:hypothetical protein